MARSQTIFHTSSSEFTVSHNQKAHTVRDMGFPRKAKITAFQSRLQVAEAERVRVVEVVTKSQVNLAWIAGRVDRVQYELRALSKELKLLELPDPDEQPW
jgi:hypothetical protein